MAGYRDKEVIETCAKGAPARYMDVMSPTDRKGEVYMQRRQASRDQYLAPRRRSPAYHDDDDDDAYDRHARGSRSLDVSRRPSRHRRDDRLVRRHHYDSSSSSSSSDSDSDVPSRRRKTKVRPCGSVCRDPSGPKNDPDADKPYESAEELKERAKRRKNDVLTAGLATVTTVAACNGIYQNAKLYHARKDAMKDGEMCTHEFEKLKTKGNLMSAFALGVCAISLNNVRLGWMRHENTKAAGKEAEKQAWERKLRREEEERYGRDDRYR